MSSTSPPPPAIEAIHQQLQGIPLVCLMANYNKKETIEKAIRSVLMQQADFPFKLIVTDDHSTDGSYEIAVELAKQNPEKIIVIRSAKNEGYLARTLEGYGFLKGVKYFCFLDSDDWYLYPKKFSDAFYFLESHPNYVGYFANYFVLTPDSSLDEKTLLRFDLQHPKHLDFDWEDYKKGKGIWVQTTGSIFRNVYFQNDVPQRLLDFAKRKDGRAFEGDGFRVPWHVKAGRVYFVNRKESVYNYDKKGLWSKLTEIQQTESGIRGGFAFAEFFGEKDADYFYKGAQSAFENLLSLLQQNPEQIPEYEAFLKDAFSKIYLNPQYNAVKPTCPNELFPFVFWAANKALFLLRSKLIIRTRLNKLLLSIKEHFPR